MDFIERLFQVSLDGGNGTFELLLSLLPLIAGAALWFSRRARAKQRH